MDSAVEGDGFDLVNLDGISLADLAELEPTVFAHSLHRVMEEIDHPQDAIAGWQSAL
jgi:FXSXX-COOH protein